MNAAPSSTHKISLLCEHVENLCAQSVRLMEAGEAVALSALQERKGVMLAELRALISQLSATTQVAFRDRISQRLQSALASELRGVNEMLLDLKQKLHANAAAKLRLAQIRKGYGNQGEPVSQVYGGFLSACG